MDRRVALATRMLGGACARIRQRARRKLGMRQDLARTTLLLAFGTLGSIFLHGVVEGSYEAGRGVYEFPQLGFGRLTTEVYLRASPESSEERAQSSPKAPSPESEVPSPKLQDVVIKIEDDYYDVKGFTSYDDNLRKVTSESQKAFWQTEFLKGHVKTFQAGVGEMSLRQNIRRRTDLRGAFSAYMKERPLSTALATGWGQLRDGGFLFVAAFVLLYVFKHTCLRVHLVTGDRVKVTGRGEILFNGSRHPVAVRGKLRKGKARVVSATERSCDLRLSDGSTVTVTNPRVYRTPRPRRLAVYLVAANMLLLTSQLLVAKKKIPAEFKDGTSRTLTYERFLMSMVAVATLLTA